MDYDKEISRYILETLFNTKLAENVFKETKRFLSVEENKIGELYIKVENICY